MGAVNGFLDVACATDPGVVRSHNEDSVAADPELGVVVLADGLGGYNAGEVASHMAVAMVTDELRRQLDGANVARRARDELFLADCFRKSILQANDAILQTARSDRRYARMGTTLVAALFHGDRVTVAHIGDSRMYRLRHGHFEQITRDHSLVQEQIDSGFLSKEAARWSHNRNLVTRALGVDPEVVVDVGSDSVEPDDLYLLCSDGLTNMVEDPEIQQALEAHRNDLPLAAQELVRMANDNGGKDNISVIVVRITDDFAAQPSWFSRYLPRES